MTTGTTVYDHIETALTSDDAVNGTRLGGTILRPGESEFQHRLNSPLYGGLIHAAVVTAVAVDADVAGIRLYETPASVELSYVDPSRLALEPEQREQLQRWPRDPHSIFAACHRQNIRNQVFRPNKDDETQAQWFADVQSIASVVDAIVLPMPVVGNIWAILTILRCNDRPPFDDAVVQTLQRLQPSLSLMLMASVQRDNITPQGVGSQTPADGLQPAVVGAQLHAKLTRTERQVLGNLLARMTEKQIAEKIHRSPHTVHVHVKNIYRKANVNARAELLALFDNLTSGASGEASNHAVNDADDVDIDEHHRNY